MFNPVRGASTHTRLPLTVPLYRNTCSGTPGDEKLLNTKSPTFRLSLLTSYPSFICVYVVLEIALPF